jgi:hypothetical protein
MKIPNSIDLILDYGETLFRHSMLSSSRPAGAAPVPPPPEEAALETHLKSLGFDELYAAIVALEIGRGVLHPRNFMTAYLAVSGTFPLHFQAVERLLKDPTHLASYLEEGLLRLHEAGVDVNRLFAAGKG